MDRGPDADPDESDAALVARYAAGDQSAARALTLRHGPRILALARRMLDDAAEAEDVTQETMLRLWQSAPDWRPDGAALATWLYRVASNRCIDRLRRRREHPSAAVPDRADDSPGALARLETADRAAALRAALAELPDRQRLAIVLRHFEDRTNPEIATILGTSVEAVESLLARGRRDLGGAAGTAARRTGVQRVTRTDQAHGRTRRTSARLRRSSAPRGDDAPLRPELLSAILADAAAASAARAWLPRRVALGRRLRELLEPLGGLRGAAALGVCAALGFGVGLTGGIGLDATGIWSDPAAEAAAEPVVAFFDFAAED